MQRKRNIFVIGLDEFNLRQLRTVRGAENYDFHGLLPFERIISPPAYAMDGLMADAERELHSFAEPVDAIIAHWDFPVSMMVPLLRRRRGMPGPTLQSVIQLEHKFWSRLLQRSKAPEMLPRFAAFDPFGRDPLDCVRQAGIGYPFWMKPVKAHSSHLGFLIRDEAEFDRALTITRGRIGRLKKPLAYFLQYVELPPEVDGIDGGWCIAEEIISQGHQCTLEGFVWNGEVTIYGIIDSLREHEIDSVLSRYRYPSAIPDRIQRRMVDAAARVMAASALEASPFNIEFFWDETDDRISVLEINPRISKSHCPLFELVAGASHHEVLIELAFGRKPDFPRREGAYDVASKWMLRRDRDAFVRRVPSPAEIADIERRVPGSRIVLEAREGEWLSDLEDQDSYSFEYAAVFLGAGDEDELREKEAEIERLLAFDFADEPKKRTG